MYIEWPEGILDLVIITKTFLEEYCIWIGKSMYGNVDAALLWIRLLAKYLVNECNLKNIKAESCTLFRKDEKRNLKLVMSVHVDCWDRWKTSISVVGWSGIVPVSSGLDNFFGIDIKPLCKYRGTDIYVFHLSQKNNLTQRSSWWLKCSSVYFLPICVLSCSPSVSHLLGAGCAHAWTWK